MQNAFNDLLPVISNIQCNVHCDIKPVFFASVSLFYTLQSDVAFSSVVFNVRSIHGKVFSKSTLYQLHCKLPRGGEVLIVSGQCN